ncbi:MAG: TM0106 family RecB-like putative nuclease [Chloroflexi bacterium]|nr:TM0106 family RecB-like putative nuclease [Chloroflexota bacterium]
MRLAKYVDGALALIARVAVAQPAATGRAGESAMQLIDDRLVYSATDLVAFLECRHLANLERAAALRHLKRPFQDDPVLDRMARRGREYEERFLEGLRAQSLRIEEIRPPDTVSGSAAVGPQHNATLRAMRDGVDVIYQAVLLGDRRLGYADFLRRVETPSDLGSWSYEVWDTKLARHPTAPAVLQIGMYSNLLGAMQGRQPERMHLALGGVARRTESLRVADFAAYGRLVAREFEAMLDELEPAVPVVSKPEPVGHCDFCRWSQTCRDQWRQEDDLALVANLTSRQRRALHAIDVTTRRGLANPSPPLPDRLDGVSPESLERAQAQAAIQVRGDGRVISERIPPERDRDGTLVPDRGLWALPEPSPGDLFLDLEGDPFFGSEEIDGVDYLFGVIEPGWPDAAGDPTFHAFWSIADGTVTPAAERQAFEDCVDLIMDRWADHPGMHVYHYAPYETGAMKRLAGRYATREAHVDQLLRGKVFVDLYRVVRQGIRASVESYSIKRLEPLYGFKREVDLRDAGESIVEFEHWLEPGEETDRDGLLEQIRAYNRDDCLSTYHLREWLEGQRAALVNEVGAEAPPRPMDMPVEETEDSDVQQAVQELVAELTADLPVDLTDGRTLEDPAQRGRWLLAQLLDWHRREDKAFWWRYFHLRDVVTDEERVDESDALGQLSYAGSRADPRPRSRSTIYRFRFPPQDHKFEVGDRPHDQHGVPVGEVVAVDDHARVIELRVASSRATPVMTSLIPYEYVDPGPKPPSLWNLAAWVIDLGIDAPAPYRAARDLLLRRPPRLGQAEGAPLAGDGEDAQDAARRLVLTLDESYLAIQGPPGSGKSTVGAEMIVDLVAAGKRVGVTANSHKVIGELLEKTARVAAERGVPVRIGQRTRFRSSEPEFADAQPLANTGAACRALATGSLDVVGGTSWLWARAEAEGLVDVLCIDEAGQMSLADALASARCADSLVLLGDPQQLDQPLQGVHPPGAERSVLAHVLDGARVMPEQFGLFLDGTWRLHPSICDFTSEVFYEDSLRSHDGRENLDLAGSPPFRGTGLRFVEVEHERRVSDSEEEAAAIAESVDRLLRSRPAWTDAEGATHTLTEEDVLIITPYNRQIRALESRPELRTLRIGTVDKFQGQEAPIAIYSMATSSAEEAPRGMEFLYSLNRLNVATSRAKCLAVVVASPGLLAVRCRTPRQMHLANALARLFEMASDEIQDSLRLP